MSSQGSIAHYRINYKLGQGGMGEVYRATDTKLNRDVAIKVLPDAFAADPERMARFRRESQVLASLNHPNIAAIHGVEERAIVMELVEGEKPAGPLAVEDALPIIAQLIDALEYAHERGVIHRDLKPANIKITPQGRVKILDFGLAKAMSLDPPSGDPLLSPTISMHATTAGVVLGTAAYMAPEQARGHSVDKRADIWAFGVVLYEILTGKVLFGSATVSDTLAAVLRQDVDLTLVPERFQRLLRLCLTRDPKLRLREIGDARFLMDEPAIALPSTQPARPGAYVWAAALFALSTAILAVFLWLATRPTARPMQRFSADLGPDAIAGSGLTAAVSPDGTRIVFLVRSAGGSLATRRLDDSKAMVLAGTEGAADPFFSPDGQWVGFFSAGKMKKVLVQGGAAVVLCDAAVPRGAWWGEDGFIVAALNGQHLSRVPEAGGEPQTLTKPEDHKERTHRWPQVLPGGQTVLFTAHTSAGIYEDATIQALSLKTGQWKVVQRGGYFGRYLPSGHLVYVHQGNLFAVPFDAASLETRGSPKPVLDDIAGNSGQAGGQFDFSRTGTLVYLNSAARVQTPPLVWMDRSGKTTPLFTMPLGAGAPRLSPDGKRLAFTLAGDLSVYEIARDSVTRLTFAPGEGHRSAVWTPDGKHLVYAAVAGHNTIRWIRADGSGQPESLIETPDSAGPAAFSPDGRTLLLVQPGNQTSPDIVALPLDLTDPEHPKPGKPELLLGTPAMEFDPAISPDGRWLAYVSNPSAGNVEVFVRPLSGDGQWQISNGGGNRYPTWSRTAKELFYEMSDGHIMVVDYTVQDGLFAAGKPRSWCERANVRQGNARDLELAPDGKRFVVFAAGENSGVRENPNLHMTFLLNFFDELRRRVP